MFSTLQNSSHSCVFAVKLKNDLINQESSYLGCSFDSLLSFNASYTPLELWPSTILCYRHLCKDDESYDFHLQSLEKCAHIFKCFPEAMEVVLTQGSKIKRSF